jgi:hypothetical protein
MFAIAEVYRPTSGRCASADGHLERALAAPLTGRVERIRPRVRKQDVVGTDPAARRTRGSSRWIALDVRRRH